METFATVIVLLAMIALGALAIQLFTASHSDRIATLPTQRARGRAGTSGTGDRRDHRDGGRGRLRPRRRTRSGEK
jgi:hypothetical protein